MSPRPPAETSAAPVTTTAADDTHRGTRSNPPRSAEPNLRDEITRRLAAAAVSKAFRSDIAPGPAGQRGVPPAVRGVAEYCFRVLPALDAEYCCWGAHLLFCCYC